MKPALIPPSQDASHPVSAVVIRQIGPNALGQPLCARVRLAITESEASKIGVLTQWQTVRRRQQRIADKKASAESALELCVANLLEHAETKEWSQRKLASEAGLSWGGWLRCRDGKARPAIWLPKLQAAVQRITEQPCSKS